MQLQAIIERDRHTRSQLATGTREVIVEGVVVDLHLVALRKFMNARHTHVRLHDAATRHGEVTPCGHADFAQQRAGTIPLRLHAVVQPVILALDDHGGPLRERLDEVAVVQFDVATELHRTAQADIVVIALGTGTVAHADFGVVAKAVEFEHAVEVVAGVFVQPGGVGAHVITLHGAGGATAHVQIRGAVPCEHTDQPLTVTDRQGCIGPQREALLRLLITQPRRLVHIVFVAVRARPAAGLTAVQTQLTHARAQGGQLAIPDSRRGVEQGEHRAGAGADGFGRRVEEPVSSGSVGHRVQGIGIGPDVHYAGSGQRKGRVSPACAHHGQLLGRCRVDAGTRDNQGMGPCCNPSHIQEVMLIGGKIHIHQEGAVTGQGADIQLEKLIGRTKLHRTVIDRHRTDAVGGNHVPDRLTGQHNAANVIQVTGEPSSILQRQSGVATVRDGVVPRQ